MGKKTEINTGKVLDVMGNLLECLKRMADNKCDKKCVDCKFARDAQDIIGALEWVVTSLKVVYMLEEKREWREDIEELDNKWEIMEQFNIWKDL